jgi:hypothetical protein
VVADEERTIKRSLTINGDPRQERYEIKLDQAPVLVPSDAREVRGVDRRAGPTYESSANCHDIEIKLE